jgi:hypothetical protein
MTTKITRTTDCVSRNVQRNHGSNSISSARCIGKLASVARIEGDRQSY